MAVISLPDWAVPSGAEPFLRDFGTVLTPFLGGPEQRINRLGTRFGLRVTLPPMSTRDKALIVQSRLLRAREDRLLMEWPQPDFDTGNPGAPLVSAVVASGTTLPLKGMTPGYVIKEGQMVSIIHGGRRYMEMASADATVGAGGTVSATIWPLLRSSLSVNDVVEIAAPKIEGLVSPGDELSWQISVDRLASFSFTISEGA
ncbi:hypothetical protein BV98_001440 [Sphingobium herbicidovorans NBRC 16415]|uniref:Uncharacterized protein n=1 Tax=Sphingobium herbicidovorans (strain ATCC 700291 / DSM 11019 / CCUG 56400 / KCTC 2939 / LMG 18315 / NBRC 16415 / MH) TaxID=1219045 RepID=A0A086PBG0_SPHHM|nr:hypothetical protein [Sphingobium herbicidovorans]KFG90728.1 hypothetical protein BV98_001440 [Sphingobium herbicidovorans NBRC 16415]